MYICIYVYVCIYIYIYIYIYVYTYAYIDPAAQEILAALLQLREPGAWPDLNLKIHQRGVQWKQGVVIYMMLHTSL